MGTNINNASAVAAASQRIAALQKYLGAKDIVFINGAAMTTASLVAVFQASIDTRAQVVTTQGEYRSAVAARHSAESERVTTDEALKSYVLNRFGANSSEAHDFGYAARKVGAASAATKARAVRLNQATREARGTVGKKKKLKIKGTLPAASEATSTSTSATSTTPAPAATTSAAPAATVITTVSPTATTTTTSHS